MDHRSTHVIGSRGLKKLYDLTTILKLDIVQPATSLQGLILRRRVCETVCVCETMCVYVPQEPSPSETTPWLPSPETFFKERKKNTTR